jgi:uncharacterized protein (DUF1697 family)
LKTYIAILRGINVSGKNIIKMDALRNALSELNYQDIKTYIQSGNVFFKSSASDSGILETKINKKIFDTWGFNVPVIVKEVSEVKIVYKNNPFVNNRNEDIKYIHVTFLSDPPSKENLEKIKQCHYEPDEYIISGKYVYLFCPGGYGNTKLSNTFFENKLKVSATTRNWKTVGELIKLAGD